MPTSVKIDAELKARIQQLADARQRSAHWIMREAIRDYVDREESKESFKQEALNSWTAYQETGQHLTG
jgi:predicted transcriptional regulator